ncbi:hypothetical protein B0H13DRAFT_1895601 [Mycena leptocephala]|nr:hypothetical protein B0H13DRAFT_1895601 [Mycena leptocephala]
MDAFRENPSDVDAKARIVMTEANIRRFTAQIDELDRPRALGATYPCAAVVYDCASLLLLATVSQHLVIGSPKPWAAGLFDVRTDGRNDVEFLQMSLNRSPEKHGRLEGRI